MHNAPSEASILRSMYEKITGTEAHRQEQLLQIVRDAELMVLKNRNLHVDEQILAFADVLSKIKDVVLK